MASEELGEAMSPPGPFFSGTNVTAIDLLLIPFAYRIDALLGHYRDFSPPTCRVIWPRYQRWYESMCSTAVFQGTLTDPDNYRQCLIEHYLPYSLGQGTTGRHGNQVEADVGGDLVSNRNENGNDLC